MNVYMLITTTLASLVLISEFESLSVRVPVNFSSLSCFMLCA